MAYNVSVSSPYAPIFGAVKSAAADLERGQTASGLQKLQAADNQAAAEVRTLKGAVQAKKAALPGAKGSAKRRLKESISSDVASANQLINVRREIAHANNTLASAGRGGAMSAPSQGQQAQGIVQAPQGAGKFLRVPFVSNGDNGVVDLNDPYENMEAGSAANRTMNTRQLSWLEYKVHGILIERQSDAAGATDQINVQDIRAGGGPNLILSEGPVAVESFRMGDKHLCGLRDKPVITSPNTLTLTLQGTAIGGAVRNGNSVIMVSAVVEVISDSTYGTINAWQTDDGMGRGGGYINPMGAPDAGTLQRVPLRTTVAAGVNIANTPAFRVTNAVPTVQLQSELIAWAELQIVGLEVFTPIKAQITDVLLFEDLQVNGGATLFAQENTIPAINFLGDEGGRGGGMHTMVGLRAYPHLSSSNRAVLTVTGEDGILGVLGPAGNIDVPGVNLLVDRLHDDVFGSGPVGPYAEPSAIARRLAGLAY